MNTRTYLDWGFAILKTLREKTELMPDLTYGMSRPLEVPIDTRYFEEKLEKLTIYFNDSNVVEKIEYSNLLGKIPFISTIDEDWFDEIYRLIVNLAEFNGTWQEHFAINQTSYLTIWEFPQIQKEKRLADERSRAEDERLEKERKQKLFTESLIQAQENLERPQNQSPCFAETRKNGLNCNSGDLVTIKSFQPVNVNGCEYKISVKKCRQCWQTYKEYFGTEMQTQQFFTKYLKANESNVEKGFRFSIDEAKEYDKIDFRSFFNPNLKNLQETVVNTLQNFELSNHFISITQSTEDDNLSNHTVYQDSFKSDKITIETLSDILLWHLATYDILDNRTFSGYKVGNVINVRDEIIGDVGSAHLKLTIHEDHIDDTDSCGYQALEGVNLIHSLTGGKLSLSVRIELNKYDSNQIKIRFEGEKDMIEKLRSAVKELINDSLQS